MADLRQRFAALDAIPVPNHWPQIAARASARTRPIAGVTRVRSGDSIPGFWPGRAVLLIALIVALAVASVAAGAWLIDSRVPSLVRPTAPPATNSHAPATTSPPSSAAMPRAVIAFETPTGDGSRSTGVEAFDLATTSWRWLSTQGEMGALSPDGRWLLTYEEVFSPPIPDYVVVSFDHPATRAEPFLPYHAQQEALLRVGPSAWSADSHYLAAVVENTSVAMADALDGFRPVTPLAIGDGSTIESLSFVGDTPAVAVLTSTGDLYSSDSAGVRRTTADHPFALDWNATQPELRIAPDGSAALALGADASAIAVSLTAGNETRFGAPVTDADIWGWSGDSRYVGAGHMYFDVEAGTAYTIPTTATPSGCSSTPVWSPIGNEFALLDGGALIVGTAGGSSRTIATNICAPGRLGSVNWSPDARTLAVVVTPAQNDAGGATVQVISTDPPSQPQLVMADFAGRHSSAFAPNVYQVDW